MTRFVFVPAPLLHRQGGSPGSSTHFACETDADMTKRFSLAVNGQEVLYVKSAIMVQPVDTSRRANLDCLSKSSPPRVALTDIGKRMDFSSLREYPVRLPVVRRSKQHAFLPYHLQEIYHVVWRSQSSSECFSIFTMAKNTFDIIVVLFSLLPSFVLLEGAMIWCRFLFTHTYIHKTACASYGWYKRFERRACFL